MLIICFYTNCSVQPGLKFIKLFPCSIQLSMNFFLLINSQLLIGTVVFLLSLAESVISHADRFENNWHFYI